MDNIRPSLHPLCFVPTSILVQAHPTESPHYRVTKQQCYLLSDCVVCDDFFLHCVGTFCPEVMPPPRPDPLPSDPLPPEADQESGSETKV